jgi:transcriptional regulator with XRE-family HTH domain
MDERLPFGLVLKRFRLAAGLTHEALAERASLGARTISDLERGVSRVPRADTLALLVEALELSPSQQAVLEAAARRYPDVSPGAGSRARNPNQLPLPLTSFVGRDQETPAIHRCCVGMTSAWSLLPVPAVWERRVWLFMSQPRWSMPFQTERSPSILRLSASEIASVRRLGRPWAPTKNGTCH